MLIKISFLKQPYMEQAARDKARAEQEKSDYEVRTVDHPFSAILTVPFRIRTPAAVVMARMMKSRASVVITIRGHNPASPLCYYCPS
jgi:hypothetical protein